VRNLKKHLEKIYRKSAFKLVQQGAKLVAVEEEQPAQDDQQQQEQQQPDSSSTSLEAAEQPSSSDADSASSSSSSSASSQPSSTDSSSASESSSSSSSGVLRVVYEGGPVTISGSDLKDYVGLPPFAQDKFYDTTPTGVVMGLAWTAMGGATLYVEAAPIIEVRAAQASAPLTGHV
jgi:Lon-like ATP-dependent protease